MGQPHPKPGDCSNIFSCQLPPKTKRQALQSVLEDVYSAYPFAIGFVLGLCLAMSIINLALMWRVIARRKYARHLEYEAAPINREIEALLSEEILTGSVADMDMGKFVHGIDAVKGRGDKGRNDVSGDVA